MMSECDRGILDLPEELIFHIFDYLYAVDIYQLSLTNTQLYNIARSDVYWRQRLRREHSIICWDGIKEENMDTFEGIIKTQKNLDACDIFHMCKKESWSLDDSSYYSVMWKSALRASYNAGSLMKTAYAKFKSLAGIGQAVMSPPPPGPKIVICGPGIETKPSRKLVHHFVNGGESGLFETLALIPGKNSNGIGAGVCVKYKNHALHLITLYTNTLMAREAATNSQRFHNSRLLKRDSGEQFQLRPEIKELIRNTDALIFVTNSDNDMGQLYGYEELRMFLGDHLPEATPLLILSCSKTKERKKYSANDVLEHLHLKEVKNPWAVCSVFLNGVSGIQSGLNWMLSHQNVRSVNSSTDDS